MGTKRCVVCGAPVRDSLCEACRSAISHDHGFISTMDFVDEVVIMGTYTGLLKEMVLAFKFKDKTYYKEPLADLMVFTLFQSGLKRDWQAITYVPMTARDERQRGYNQSRLLAEAISELTGLPLYHGLTKAVPTKAQVDLSAAERQGNLHGAFRAALPPKKLLLVDDVLTTGATIEEVAKTLKAQGTKKVTALLAATPHV
ncbi:ComF family protein [Peptoniphilus equinus]|uniref:ComF family protein n=1 Tax=Peptoniphilus equinus TaxID=3016343 RepID=A0ABY7QVM5_9FIRM|nr:ComF family protein [Peptoniphilus equinus]WBW50144.1 ComF family protein [Peptoniphilus equinus]